MRIEPRKWLRAMAVMLVFWPLAPALAALPDPVELGIAVEIGHHERVRAWLDEGMNPDMEADRIGTGLMIAAWEGDIRMMELFLSRGADLHRTNRFGEQALQLAAWRGKTEAVRWLLDRGAAVNREGDQWSALHYAVFAGHDEIVRLLMARGADINARAPNAATPLMMAAREGKEELAKLLIDAGADARAKNDRGDTALTWAMRYGNFRIAKMVTVPEVFAEAVKAPPQTFGEPRRSVPAPSEITQLLEKIREAEAKKEPTEALRLALFEAIEKFRAEAVPLDGRTARPAKPGRGQALVITASRKGKGERAEVVNAPEPPAAAAMTPARIGWDYEESRLDEFKALLRRLDEAEKAGRPKAELAAMRREVQEAYRRLRER